MKRIRHILFFIALFVLMSSKVYATETSLYISPNSGTFYTGSTFDVSILINTGGKNINAIKADLKFDSKKLQVVNPATGKSFISIWTTPPSYSNEEGTLSFQGGIPSPGINTSSGSVLTVTFRAIEPGEATVSFLDSSKILLDDGNGTNVLNFLGSANYKISLPPPEGPIVSSSTHPDQNKWYKNNNVVLSWNNDSEISNFSYSLDQDSQGFPNQEIGNKTSISFSNLEDGVYYFHIKGEKNEEWGGISHYLIRIDSSNPASFKTDVSPSTKTSFSQPIISFVTTDAYSEIDYYEVKVVNISSKEGQSQTRFIETTSPYQIPALEVGKYLIVVRAYDRAGNWQEESIEIEISPENLLITERGVWLQGVFISWWPLLMIIIIFIIIILFSLIMLWRREKRSQTWLRERLSEKERIIREHMEKAKDISNETIHEQ